MQPTQYNLPLYTTSTLRHVMQNVRYLNPARCAQCAHFSIRTLSPFRVVCKLTHLQLRGQWRSMPCAVPPRCRFEPRTQNADVIARSEPAPEHFETYAQYKSAQEKMV